MLYKLHHEKTFFYEGKCHGPGHGSMTGRMTGSICFAADHSCTESYEFEYSLNINDQYNTCTMASQWRIVTFSPGTCTVYISTYNMAYILYI